MVLDTAFMITALVTMFVVIDPIGIAPLFLALTSGMSQAQRRRVAVHAGLVAGLVLVLFAFFGEAVLGFIGISMPAFRIAGGILLFLTALDMLFERRSKRREDRTEGEEIDDPSVFPLAIPLIAGPGSIASIILLIGEKPGGEGLIMVLGITALTLVVLVLTLMLSGYLDRIIGKKGIDVITRILGMLLAALAVQFVLDGLAAFGFGPSAG
ncbi:MAG: MarC family protein [Sulfitobacter sp.]